MNQKSHIWFLNKKQFEYQNLKSTFLYKECYRMGSSLTVDKHLSNIQEWLQVSNRLQKIQFQAQTSSHIGMWRISQNNNKKVDITPVQIQFSNLTQLFTKDECYILYAIKKADYDNPQNNQILISNKLTQFIQNIKDKIVRKSYMTPIKKNMIDGNEYRIYSLFGRKSRNNLRLLCLSYCVKLDEVLNSKKKLEIISGGGVIRNNKVQKGSLYNLKIQQDTQQMESVSIENELNVEIEIQELDIVNFYTNKRETLNEKQNVIKPLTILGYNSCFPLPLIQSNFQRQLRPNIHSNKQIQSNGYNIPFSQNYQQRNKKQSQQYSNQLQQCEYQSQIQYSRSIPLSQNITQSKQLNHHQQIISNQQQLSLKQDIPKTKKPTLQKINLKLDFSKPLNLGTLNLSSSNKQDLNPSINIINSPNLNNTPITNRSEQRRGKREKCQQECSQIIQGLYLSGQKVAKNLSILQKHQIKHIINCAGDYCQNWFQSSGISYLTFFLKDSQNQNIQCLFYRVIDFIQNAHKNKQNVLIHCIQGISRSVTFVIAYVIFKYGYDYKKAQSFVKQKRSIACPNNGFMVELIQFHKRLYDEYDSLNKPRVFLVSSHSKETPHILTARMIKNPLFDSKKYLGLDSRAVYIIHLPEIVYVWVGSKCDEKKLQNYWNFANDFIKRLQKYQRAPLKVKAISEGSQQKEFLSIWNLQQPPKLFQNPQYDRLFTDGEPAKPGLQRQFYEQIEQQQAESHRLFIYPDHQKGLGVFSLDDLNGICILSIVKEQKGQKHLTLHIWRDPQFQSETDSADQQFLSKVIQNNFGNFDDETIEIFQEDYDKPSEVFKDAFIN